MAKKKERISVNAFEQAVKDNYENETTISWRGIDIIVRRTLPLNDVIAFTQIVAKNCFESESKEYIPEVRDFLFKRNIIDFYTNLTLPTNIGKSYELIYCSDIIDTLTTAINQAQLAELDAAIDKKIRNIADARTEAILKEIEQAYGALEQVQGQMESIVGDINANDLSKLTQFLANGNIDEEKLVKAYMSIKHSEEEQTEPDRNPDDK